MRLIGHLENEDDVRRLSLFLKGKGIETSFDGSFDANTGHMSYQLWGYEEDQALEAQEEFERFLKKPSDSMYDIPITETPSPEETKVLEEPTKPKTSFTPLTAFIIALCGFIYLLNLVEEISIKKSAGKEAAVFMTDVQLSLFYDVPPPIEKLEAVIKKYKIEPDQKIENLPPEALREVQALEKMPFWRGGYDWILLKIKGENTFHAEGAMFQKIREGEVWRIFSPAVLHIGLLHLLFNMLWAWILSRPIERKMGALRLLILVLFVGVGSNTAQYLMGGPFFLGYSGVVMGLAGFTWMREKIAPWEGYPLQRSTMLFLLIFVGAMFLIQAASFGMQIFTNVNFSPNIANTAHITGALLGALLGRFSFFAERVES